MSEKKVQPDIELKQFPQQEGEIKEKGWKGRFVSWLTTRPSALRKLITNLQKKTSAEQAEKPVPTTSLRNRIITPLRNSTEWLGNIFRRIKEEVKSPGVTQKDLNIPLLKALNTSSSIEKKLKAAIAAIEQGSDVNATSSEGSSTLDLAVQTEDIATIKQLLEKGATIDDRARQRAVGKQEISGIFESHTKLLDAIDREDLKATMKAIEQGAGVNVANKNGTTALHLAAKLGDVETVKKLIQKNADITAVDRWGGTPLIVALSQRKLGVVNELCQHEPDLKNTSGIAPRTVQALEAYYRNISHQS